MNTLTRQGAGNAPALTLRPMSPAWFRHWLWDRDIAFSRSGVQLALLIALSAAALLIELSFHHGALGFAEALSQKTIVVFYNVKAVVLSEVDATVASILITAGIARITFGLLVAIADILMYRKATGRPFDWEAMINISLVNLVFLTTAVFTFTNPWVASLLDKYTALLDHVPTLVNLNGPLALLIACLVGDFCFYWSHRWCHKIRFFWNLGHVNHHRSQNLCQLTQAVDPHSFLLDTAGGKVFVLLLLPLATKLMSLDVRYSGWALIAVIAFDIWTDPSHSVALYYAEIRLRVLRAFRWVLVTPGVHFTHHSREEAHNVCDGCNFGARFTLWDRLFGTYVEPPAYIPQAGLFSDKSDYCRNPLRFLFHPWVRLFQELARNKPRHWLAILFGPTSYDPPVPANSKP